MAGMTIVVRSNRLSALAAAFPNASYDIVSETCARILSVASQRVPKGETGELSRSLGMNVDRTSTGASGVVYASKEYAAYVEFGTGQRGMASVFEGKPDNISYSPNWKGMAAQPYLTPGVEAARPFWEGEWRSLRRALRKSGL